MFSSLATEIKQIVFMSMLLRYSDLIPISPLHFDFHIFTPLFTFYLLMFSIREFKYILITSQDIALFYMT